MSHDAASALPVEARSFQQRRAGIVTRTMASTVDFVVVGLALVVLYALWNATAFLIDPYGFAFAKPAQVGMLLAGELLLLTYLTAILGHYWTHLRCSSDGVTRRQFAW